MGELRRLGLDNDTMIVFTSDNGPADEYGADPRFFGSNGPRRRPALLRLERTVRRT